MSDASLSLEDFLPYQLSIASNAVSARIAQLYGDRFALKIPEWRLMAVLGQGVPMTQRDLCAATRMDKVTVNRAAAALAARSLVVREPSAGDGRSHHLVLTKTGRALYDDIAPAAKEAEAVLFAALSGEEWRTLRALLQKVRAAADGD